MKPPRKIRVGCHRYDVIVDAVGLVGEHAELRGSTVSDSLTIALDGRLPRSVQQETLLHEVLHAAWDTTGASAGPAKDHEELVVSALAPALLGALRRNPRLVAFLLD